MDPPDDKARSHSRTQVLLQPLAFASVTCLLDSRPLWSTAVPWRVAASATTLLAVLPCLSNGSKPRAAASTGRLSAAVARRRLRPMDHSSSRLYLLVYL